MWSKLSSNLWVPHLTTVHHILRYIPGTLDHGFFAISAYADIDRTGSPDTRQSTTR